MAVHERAVRNCPWIAALWVNYAHASERLSTPHRDVCALYERALQGGLASAADFVSVWVNYAQAIFRHAQSVRTSGEASGSSWEQQVIFVHHAMKNVFRSVFFPLHNTICASVSAYLHLLLGVG